MTHQKQEVPNHAQVQAEILSAAIGGEGFENEPRRYRTAALRSLEIGDLERASVYATLAQAAGTDRKPPVALGPAK